MLLFGSDYMRPYTSDREEIANINWMPSSLDFRQTAANSGGGTGIANFNELLSAIAAAPFNSIDSLGLIGHANKKVFGLGGPIQLNGRIDPGRPDQMITEQTLDAAVKAGKIRPIRNRFKHTDDTVPTITLFGCNAGADDDLLVALRDAFGVTAQGFKDELSWCIQSDRRAMFVIERGRVRVDPNPSAPKPRCATLPTDIWSLKPDRWK